MNAAQKMKGYCGSYPRIYSRLKAHGHHPAKAIEILIEAKRGHRHALNWIRMCKRLVP